MTWASFVASGSGELQFRAAIEGCPDQWVSHRSLAGTDTDGRVRRYGLVPSGIEIDERAILQEAELELSGMTLLVEEREDERATYAFARKARTLTWLKVNTGTSSPETVTVLDTTAIAVNQYVHIGTETWKVTAKAATTLTVTRAQWQSKVQKHFVTIGKDEKTSPISDAPAAFRGRRVFLYAHSPAELSPTAAGTLIWRGVVARQPSLVDLVRWQIPCDPITSLLEQEVAGDTDEPLTISGAYYPWTIPLQFQLAEYFGNSPLLGGGGIYTDPFLLTGYFPTPEALCAAMNALIAPAVSAWDNAYRFEPDVAGHPTLVVTTHATTPKYATVGGGSAIDGVFELITTMEGDAVFSVEPSTEYVARTTDTDLWKRRGWPRAWLGTSLTKFDKPVYSALTTAPHTRVYLSRPSGAVGDSLALDIELGHITALVRTLLVEIVAVNASGLTDASDVDLGQVEGGYGFAQAALDGTSKIRSARNYGASTDVRGFRDEVVALGIEKNRGSTPWITDDDLGSFAEARTAAANLGPFAQFRNYFFSKPCSLRDAFKEEDKLVSCMLVIDANYKIDARELRVSTQTSAASFVLDDSVILAGRWPTWESEKGGIVNAVLLEQGYDPKEDKHLGVPNLVRNVKSISEHSATFTLEIAPLSTNLHEIDHPNATIVASRTLGFFGGDFHAVEVDVSWKAWNVRLGDTVTLTSDKLPDPATGTRGLSGAVATVVGRHWEFPGFGRLTLLVHTKRVAGYAPAARITSVTSGIVSTLTVTQNFYAPIGVNDLSFFAVGDWVEAQRMDFGAPAHHDGVITALPSPTTVTVDFGTTAAVGSALQTWDLVLKDHAIGYVLPATITANAARFAWIASATGLYNGEPPLEFAP